MLPVLIVDSVTPWPAAVPVAEPPTQPCPDCEGEAEGPGDCGYESNGPLGWIEGACGGSGRVPLREIEVCAERDCLNCEGTGKRAYWSAVDRLDLSPCKFCHGGRVLCRVGTAPITGCVPVIRGMSEFAQYRRAAIVHAAGGHLRFFRDEDDGRPDVILSHMLPLFDWSLPWAVLLGELIPCEPEPQPWTDTRGVVLYGVDG